MNLISTCSGFKYANPLNSLPIQLESLESLVPFTYESSSAVTDWPASPAWRWQAATKASSRYAHLSYYIIFGNESDSAFGTLPLND